MEENLRLEECNKIAQQAHLSLFCSITKDVYFSWGVSKVGYGFYEGMPTLIMQVSGLLHKGRVLVSLNEGKDVYEVRLQDNEHNIIKTIDEVYFDNLGSLIDSIVEHPTGISNEEYLKRAMEDSRQKMDSDKVEGGSRG